MSVHSVPYYINGIWETGKAGSFHPVTNPATGAVIAEVPFAGAEEVDRTVQAAHAAFLKWREVPVIERVQVLYRYKALVEKYAEDIARIMTTENGKTFDDAKLSVRRAVQMVEVACGMPSLMMGDSLHNVSKDIDSYSIRQPLGVCAGITPFNFPAMVPMWMFPFAIAAGNTFILKPSEKVPLTPTRTAERSGKPVHSSRPKAFAPARPARGRRAAPVLLSGKGAGSAAGAQGRAIRDVQRDRRLVHQGRRHGWARITSVFSAYLRLRGHQACGITGRSPRPSALQSACGHRPVAPPRRACRGRRRP